ncbi:hypothetical protein [Methylobacterium nonmethylotrophicum]|uniref:Uncharacterized protein n=1 Tax=Methylobacterium nonmethylotrophicum TaxID=1141884 RepID=A0A4Z0NEI3_9HYPH|nr:hypothetical protein [Methylobacterium nonmethylotrophicum]TGD94590.1 hypothetical protein EU555_32065 [Methylobacterium nonmethylotrophicum]
MSTWDVAVVREQGVNFAVVSVRDSVIDSFGDRDKVVRTLSYELGVPTVLIGARDSRLYGRSDIVRFLQNVHPSRLPWRRITLAA